MSFGDGVARHTIKTDRELERIARGVVFELFKRVILKTPVDTGRARGNWSTSVGAAPSNAPVTNATDKSGAGAIGKVASLAVSFPMGETVWVANNLPYIMHLEYGLYPNPPKRGSWDKKAQAYVIKTVGGYSKQAPQGMVRTTALEFNGIVRGLQR
jgi:hypothetical protein